MNPIEAQTVAVVAAWDGRRIRTLADLKAFAEAHPEMFARDYRAPRNDPPSADADRESDEDSRWEFESLRGER